MNVDLLSLARRSITAVTAMCLAPPAIAACADRICSDVTIERLVTATAADSLIMTSGDEANLSCTPDGGIYLKLDMTATYAQPLYAHILSAQMANRTVSVKLSDTQSVCTIQYIYTN